MSMQLAIKMADQVEILYIKDTGHSFKEHERARLEQEIYRILIDAAVAKAK